MADPATAENPKDLTEIAKAASQLTEVVEEYRKYKLFCTQLAEAENLLQESGGK